MESAPSRSLQGVAEEIVEVDEINEFEVVIGDPKAPNKDTNTTAVLQNQSKDHDYYPTHRLKRL